VGRVENHLTISTQPSEVPVPGSAAASALPAETPPPPARYLAVGAHLVVPTQSSDTLDGAVSLGPVFRLGRGRGWRPVFVWTRLRSDLPPVVADAEPFGELRMSTLTLGLGYAIAGDAWSFSPSLTAGYSFNHMRLDPGFVVPQDVSLPVAASGSPAVLAGTTLWIEATRRVSVGVSAGYLFARPQSTWLDGDRFTRRRLHADAWLTGVSIAYWVF
jgi:hypothetical protein